MIKRNIWITIIIMALGLTVPVTSTGQSRISSNDIHSDNDSLFYLNIHQISDLLKWLPAPPDTTDEAFAHDLMRYFWGKTQRLDPKRANIAILDANFNMYGVCGAFSVPFGMTISHEDTPEIYLLLERALDTIDLICVFSKEYYMRKRPFERMNEPSLTPEAEATLSLNGSYPSAHAIRGWGAALLLAEINPAAADTLFARGLMYGESRVIVGAHWQSDVDASHLAASAAYALLHTSPAFMEQMAKAQAEFHRLSENVEASAIIPVTKGDGREYTISGTPATPESRGVIIRNNQKVVKR